MQITLFCRAPQHPPMFFTRFKSAIMITTVDRVPQFHAEIRVHCRIKISRKKVECNRNKTIPIDCDGRTFRRATLFVIGKTSSENCYCLLYSYIRNSVARCTKCLNQYVHTVNLKLYFAEILSHCCIFLLTFDLFISAY